MKNQQTIVNSIKIEGIALHSGKNVTINILPQPVDSGILFSRIDLSGQPVIKVGINAVVNCNRCTSIGIDDWHIATIEHLMAAFHGLGIDNALIEVNGDELPAGDGSSLFFVRQILNTGIQIQDKPRNYKRINTPIYVKKRIAAHNQLSTATMVILPSPNLQVSCMFTSPHPVCKAQYYHYSHTSSKKFKSEIAPARTIAFWEEIELLRSRGLALSNDPNCAVIVGDGDYKNEFRFQDEIVRHKILDIIGDLYLEGVHILGHIIATQSSHQLNFELVKRIFEE